MAQMTIKLPRYVGKKPLAGGITGFYWTSPHWARPKMVDGKLIPAMRHGKPCPVKDSPLGNVMSEAIRIGDILNDCLDGWRKGSGPKLVPGTVAWLFDWYRNQDRYLTKKAKTRNDYKRLMDTLVDETMKVGTFGQRSAAVVNAVAADTIYARWQKKRGRRQAAYAMQVCRLVWTWAVRHHDVTGVKHNPFKSMGIKTGAVVGNRPTSREEYNLYRGTAHALGEHEMAAGAALCFELCQRVWDVFGFVDEDGVKQRGFVWPDYAPGKQIVLTQSKTGKRIPLPLSAVIEGEQIALFPTLDEELALLPQLAVQMVINRKTGLPLTYEQMNYRHRKICKEAGLPSDMTFTGFRHGGVTELGDADVADVRSISGHSTLSTTAIYNHLSKAKAQGAALKRLEYLAIVSDLSERQSEQVSERATKLEAK